MPKVTYTPEGSDKSITIDVDTSAIDWGDETPDGFVPTERFESEIKRRVNSARKRARTELASDDDFFTELAEGRGYEFREDGRLKGAAKDSQEQEERWRKKHLNPLQTKLTEAQKTIETLRTKERDNEILKHADKVKPTLRDAFLREAGSKLQLDDETGKWAIKGEDGFRYTTEGKLAGAQQLIETMKIEQPDWFVQDQAQGSGHQGNSDNSGSGRVYTQREVDAIAADPVAWEEQREDITKAYAEGRVRG